MGNKIKEVNTTQKECLDKSAELWNLFIKIDKSELHPDDTDDFRFHIHALQNILYTQLYIKEKGKI